MDAGEIKTLLENVFTGAVVDVHGPDGVHFEARVVAADFAGKPTLARHRMVYAALGERMGGEIHALSLQTLTPEEASGPGLRRQDAGANGEAGPKGEPQERRVSRDSGPAKI